MNTLLIINPTSGQGRADRGKRKLLEIVREEMPDVIVHTTEGENDAEEFTARAVSQGIERVLVAGGDGTINQVINGIGDSGVPLGIIPMGTGNVLAHDFSIPVYDPREALCIIQQGRIQQMDLGTANGRRFVLMAGFGFDAAVIEDVKPRAKDLLGKMAFAPALLKQASAFDPVEFGFSFGGDDIYAARAIAVVVANCGSYAYNFQIAPHALNDDGMLDILIIEGFSGPAASLQLIGKAVETVFQQTIPDLNTTYLRAKEVRVDADPAVKVQLDGDVWASSPVNVKVLPRALKLFVP